MLARRSFLAAAAGLALAGGRPSWSPAGTKAPRAKFVTTDVGPLRRVLVHAPGPEAQKGMAIGGGDHPLLELDLLGPEAPAEHRGLVEALRRGGAEVLLLTDILDDAVARARAAGTLAHWLEQAAPRLVPHADKVDAAVLLGADDTFAYRVDPDSGGFAPLTEPLKFLLYVRDAAVATPRGVVLGHFRNPYRTFESTLMRFIFEWSSRLSKYPIVLDAQAERVYLQGGDVIVADEETLFVGVGNLTDEAAARKLAQRLGMNVVAVQMPFDVVHRRADRGHGHGGLNHLRMQFLHLDTIFSLIAPRQALAVPYFLEAEHAGADPLTEILRGLADHPEVHRDYLARTVTALAAVGQVRRYKARSGEPDASIRGRKLVDYLRDRGYEIHYVGGELPAEGAFKHVVERVLREVRFQGGNVVATAPGRLIACAGNAHTLGALEAAGATVDAIATHTLVQWHGGPHCMTLPLERDPIAG